MDDGIGDDLQDWCDARSRAVSGRPQRVADAAQYYCRQVEGRLTTTGTGTALLLARIDPAQSKVVQMIGRGEPAPRVHAALQSHPSTCNAGTYDTGDLPRLARRLQSEAENELHLLLAWAYRRGYHKLLIYPFRPPPAPHHRDRPGPPEPGPPEQAPPEPGRPPASERSGIAK